MKLLRKLANAEKTSCPGDAPDAVPPRLERVRSVQDCLDVFETESLFSEGTLSNDAVSALYSHCAVMRRQGMAMEPNLIGRAVVHEIAEPARAGESALRFASHDTDFVKVVAEADEAQSKRNFKQAERLYRQALLFYPKHPSILVQYAHALKEQGKFDDALVFYLDAATFGAPMSDVEEHALFVAGRLGLGDRIVALLSAPSSIPCSNDVCALYELLIGPKPSMIDILSLKTEHESMPSTVAALMRRKEFCQANRDLLCLVTETHWSPANA